MSTKVVSKIIAASFHRNGVGGLGFYSILFESPEQPDGLMHASLFDDHGCCAVHSVKMLSDGNIAFARGNSWRGDVFEEELRPAIKTFEESHGTGRIGPFSVIPLDTVNSEE